MATQTTTSVEGDIFEEDEVAAGASKCSDDDDLSKVQNRTLVCRPQAGMALTYHRPKVY